MELCCTPYQDRIKLICCILLSLLNLFRMKAKELFTIIILSVATPIQLQAQTPIQAMSKYAGDWKAIYTMWMEKYILESSPLRLRVR